MHDNLDLVPGSEEKKNILKNMVREWRQCKCGELVDRFHSEQTFERDVKDDLDLVELISRQRAYKLDRKTWEKVWEDIDSLIDEYGAAKLRIYMAIDYRKNPKPFMPIIRAYSDNGIDKKSYGEPYLFEQSDIPASQSLTGKIPSSAKQDFMKSWLEIHPGYMADQFETITRNSLVKDGQPIRERVRHYTFDEKDTKEIQENKGGGSYELYLLMGINHNRDIEELPCFCPILQFVNTDNSSGSENGEGDSYEYASPCPNFC